MTPWNRRRRISLTILATGALVACETPPPPDTSLPASPSQARELVDSDGRRVHLPGPARRIISLVPSATLTLEALGAQGSVVARTDHDTAAWTRGLPSVGGGLQPSLEAILAARPELVIRFGGPQDTRTPASLDGLSIPHVAIRPDGIADVWTTIDLLGKATHREQAADSLIHRLRAGLDSVRDAAAQRTVVRVAYVLGGDPPWVAGPGSYIHELMELAGGENVFADLGSLYAAVSPEEFLARHVDLILTPRPGRLDARVARIAPVVEVGDALELPGPGVASAAWTLLGLLHPELSR